MEVRRGRYRDGKRSTLALVLFVAILGSYFLVAPFLGGSGALGAIIGAFALGPLLGIALGGKPELKIFEGNNTYELIPYWNSGTLNVSILENGYPVRDVSLEEPVETMVGNIPVRMYISLSKIGMSKVVVEIEGKKYYLP